MMHAWIIYHSIDAQRNREYIQWFIDEAKHFNITLELKLQEHFSYGVKHNKLFLVYEQKELRIPDFVIMRSLDTLLSSQIESMGCKVYNSSVVSRIANDKAQTHQYLARHHIPMANTQFAEMNCLSEDNIFLEFPLVVKEATGRGGTNVFLVNSISDFSKIKETIGPKKVVLQQLGQPGRDVRVFVIGKTIIAAILRESTTDFRANYSLGGKSSVYNLSPTEIRIVNKVMNLFEFGMVGIDFIFDSDGNFLLNEIEDVVGSRTLSINTDINIVQLYLQYILHDLNKKTV